MTQKILALGAGLSLAFLPALAHATELAFSAYGSGVDSSITVSYGSTTDSKSGGLMLTGISGTFSDSNIGISDATITGLQALNISMPEPGNTLAPADFSRFYVASGLPHGSVSYDNLLYLSGSPQTANSYPPHGGFLDIYGVLFTLSNGDTVNLWSNGDVSGTGLIDYGVEVVTPAKALDVISGGVSVSPEPGTLCLLGTGVLSLAGAARRRMQG